MKDIKTQTKIERAIKLPSGVPGYKDREFILVISNSGIGLREKGKIPLHNFISWKEFVRWMFVHQR